MVTIPCGDLDGDEEAAGSLNLDDLCNDGHNWVAESTSTLAQLGMTFTELQGWLIEQKKACDALQTDALPKQRASVGDIVAAREKLMQTNNMNHLCACRGGHALFSFCEIRFGNKATQRLEMKS